MNRFITSLIIIFKECDLIDMGRKTRLLSSFLLLLFPLYSFATHIVGGEFEIEHLERYNYQLRLIQYFDNFYGNPGAEDQFFNAIIYRKRDDMLIETVFMPKVSSNFVPYTNIECVRDELSTKKIIYQNTIELSPEVYNDPEGYYVVWDRCCRNNIIDNINTPESTGQLFYLEFPPVVKDGKFFKNSSPSLFPPLSDYACVNREFFADFAGRDLDDDSLVYSLVDPLAGFSSTDNPKPDQTRSGPYPEVSWIEGLRTDNMVPGSNPLSINSQGLLKVTAGQTGLFVFAVKCEEFRNGEKIGEVRRDFQMLVVDCPPPGNQPTIQVKVPGTDQFYNNQDTILISGSLCLDAIVSDSDQNENVMLRLKPVNFIDDDLANQIVSSGTTDPNSNSIQLQYCLPECPLSNNEVTIVDLIAMDDACSQPLMDTARLYLKLAEPINQDPYFNSGSQGVINANVVLGETLTLPLTGLDEDLDPLTMQLEAVDFLLQDYGIQFRPVLNQNGEISYELSWDADCAKYDFTTQNEFQIRVTLDDEDQCALDNQQELLINIRVEEPQNTEPVVSTTLNDLDINARILETVQFRVTGDDEDNDLIVLNAYGEGFDLEDYGMFFNNTSGFGSTGSDFIWRINCDNVDLDQKDKFVINFLVEDNDICFASNADTLRVEIDVNRPRNQSPNILIPFNLEFNTVEVKIGQTLEFDIGARDPDGDSVILGLNNQEELEPSLAFSFNANEGRTEVISRFSWSPTCEHLSPGFQPSYYTFDFYAQDNKCYNNRTDTVEVRVVVRDVEPTGEFLPPTAFSPDNGDSYNDSFYIEHLPPDNCQEKFDRIEIYNRWGKLVYQTDNRDFAWDGTRNPPGVYFYSIKFSQSEYKGTVSLLR